MSGIEKLGGTDRNYVKVAAGGRWCRNRRVTRCTIQRCLKCLPACLPACSLHIWIWCRRWYAIWRLAVCLQLSLSVPRDFKLLCSCPPQVVTADATKCLGGGLASYHVGLSVSEQLLSAYRAENATCLDCKDQSWCAYVSVQSVRLLRLSGFNRTSASSTDQIK